MSRRTRICAATLRVEAALVALLKQNGAMDSRDVKARMAEQGFSVSQTSYARVRLKLCILQFGHVRGMYTWWSLPQRLPARHLGQGDVTTLGSAASSASATPPTLAAPGCLPLVPSARPTGRRG